MFKTFQANSIKEKAEVTILIIEQNSRQESFSKEEVGRFKLIKGKINVGDLTAMSLLQPKKYPNIQSNTYYKFKEEATEIVAGG